MKYVSKNINKREKLNFLLLTLFSLQLGINLMAQDGTENSMINEMNRLKLAHAVELKAKNQAISSCNYGDINMCFLVGNGYQKGYSSINNIGISFEYDDFKAVQFLSKACNGGSVKGCTALGTMYDEGKGTTQNKDKAAQLFTKACNANEASACNNLGVMYQNGYGMWGNKSKAKEFYSKACQLRSQAGCTNYANLNK